MTRYTPIPELPLGGTSEWMFVTLSAMKENIDLLTGQRGEADHASVALPRSAITVAPPPDMNLKGMTATGGGYTIDNIQVPSLDDHVKLINDVRTLALDVINLRSTLTTLINQLKG